MAFIFNKNWDVAKAYVVGDNVISVSKQYVCTASHTGETPPNASYWKQISKWLDNTKTFVASAAIPAGSPVSVTSNGKIEVSVSGPTIGVTVQDLALDESGAVVVFGNVENGGWDWDEDLPVWVDEGDLTQVVPTTVLQQVGVAVSPTSILVNPQHSITLL